MKIKSSVSGISAMLMVSCFFHSNLALAAPTPEAMQKQIEAMEAEIQLMKAQLANMQQPAAPAQVPANSNNVTSAPVSAAHEYIERKSGNGVTLLTRNGELSIYGNLDISVETVTKGISALTANGMGPVGSGGWMPDISTNISYFGIRGFQQIPGSSANFVYQLETQLDISATSGSSQTNSAQSDAVKGGLTSRNSFIGFSEPTWGAVKIGKTDAPYKTSTAVMNPFVGMVGDYAVIMGNTGGDNRVEFGTRLDHSIWYESPNLAGFKVNVLVSPGQNRGYDNSNIAAGESDCSGGNIPGSGGLPVACNDGSYGTAYSASLGYSLNSLYLVGAYEMHKKVNRTSDLAVYDPNDVANEDAAKIGIQYKFATGTTVSAIAEKMKRHVPDYLMIQNERQRSGYWLAASQTLTDSDSIHLGWAHANKAPGDPGQHNTGATGTNLGIAGADNAADMFTVAWKHMISAQLSYYLNYAVTDNRPYAHYDLGAGGRSVATDCHDASNPDTSGFDPNGNAPHCWAGGKLQGASLGLRYTF